MFVLKLKSFSQQFACQQFRNQMSFLLFKVKYSQPQEIHPVMFVMFTTMRLQFCVHPQIRSSTLQYEEPEQIRALCLSQLHYVCTGCEEVHSGKTESLFAFIKTSCLFTMVTRCY